MNGWKIERKKGENRCTRKKEVLEFSQIARGKLAELAATIGCKEGCTRQRMPVGSEKEGYRLRSQNETFHPTQIRKGPEWASHMQHMQSLEWK
ncbi:hypothetical protein IWW43_003649, partial [Coemansia sp. RSA 1935]